jgi:hypothetical protein
MAGRRNFHWTSAALRLKLRHSRNVWAQSAMRKQGLCQPGTSSLARSSRAGPVPRAQEDSDGDNSPDVRVRVLMMRQTLSPESLAREYSPSSCAKDFHGTLRLSG